MEKTIILGELALDGSVREIKEIFSMPLKRKRKNGKSVNSVALQKKFR